MTVLELLAPARNKDIGVAAIDCGADAVYIAGPDFGARKTAGNSFEDISALCTYAHKFGARIFVTFNTVISDNEKEEAHRQMLAAQEAGADAFIIRDPEIAGWKDIHIPLHASTQCAIRDAEKAKYYEGIGCARIILERELPLSVIREICSAVNCEVEFFVHGALCVCYSGECRLSEFINGRSADKGECIQACRSLYDLTDEHGRVLVKNKALLSLKDYNLKERLEDLAEAGVSSFKIEGRLKNESYVKNVVRDYDIALNNLIARHPEEYCRASFGHVTGGFVPNLSKTFNRGYTQLFLDGKRGKWSSMDAPKSMGEAIGIASSIRRRVNGTCEIEISPYEKGLILHNGDGFAFASEEGVIGFRGDVCSGTSICCKTVPGLKEGLKIFRNIDSLFEKEIESRPCRREISVELFIKITYGYTISSRAVTEDGRSVEKSFHFEVPAAINTERAESILREQLSKRTEHYSFRLAEMAAEGGDMPLLSAAAINGMRRELTENINRIPCNRHHLPTGRTIFNLNKTFDSDGTWLIKSKYCIRYELGMCPVHQKASHTGPLFLVNNGKRFALEFDCRNCEMTVTSFQK